MRHAFFLILRLYHWSRNFKGHRCWVYWSTITFNIEFGNFVYWHCSSVLYIQLGF